MTAPTTQPTTTSDTNDVHVVCCDEDLAMCGVVLTGGTFLPDDAPVDCPICEIVDGNGLPCDDPCCPFRQAARR